MQPLMLNVYSDNLDKSFRVLLFISLSVALLILTSCTPKANPDKPNAGDYGQEIVTSVSLSPEQIKALNEAKYPQPFNKVTRTDNFVLKFKGDSSLNPYRVVVVSEGRAILEDEVNIMFAGILQKVKPKDMDRPIPQIYREEDDINYRVYQKGSFINISEPFSFNNLNETVEYQLDVQITNKKNFNFDKVDIQLWQGFGERQSDYSNYKLFMVIFIGAFLAYRTVFGSRK